MPSPSSTPRVPSCRRHKPSGQAVVTLAGKDHYLGRYGTRASRAEYDRLIGEWLAGGRALPPNGDGEALTVVDWGKCSPALACTIIAGLRSTRPELR